MQDVLVVVPSRKKAGRCLGGPCCSTWPRACRATILLCLRPRSRHQSPKFTLPFGQQTNNRVLFGNTFEQFAWQFFPIMLAATRRCRSADTSVRDRDLKIPCTL